MKTKRKLWVTLVVVSVSVSIPQAAEDEDKEDSPAWRLDPLATVGAGLLDSDLSGAKSTTEFFGLFDADVQFVRHKDGERFFDLGFGLGLDGTQQSGSPEVEPFNWGGRVFLDGDLLGGKRPLTAGMLYGRVDTDINGDEFGSSDRLSGVLMWSLATTDTGCELSNVKAYVRRDDYDDREQGVAPEFDRSGEYVTIGIEANLLHSHVRNELGKRRQLPYTCVRRGPFRRMIPEQLASARLVYENEDRDLDTGVEFDGTFDRFFAEGQLPIMASEWSFVGHFDYVRGRFSNPSQFDPQVKRRDDFRGLEVGARWHARRWISSAPRFYFMDAFFGVGTESRDSNVSQYVFDRWYVTLGLEFGFLRPKEQGMVPAGSGTRTTVTTGGSGEADPVVVDEVP